ncbi:predicted protein [Sclerotinia sclerotiorum 1980 UF-70]|uniref:Uncharacterized protein n=1 Tax=Sclerotinia sclerotiorum (strain ATCC 18683 / 1980 / Ss-1) TaxID=665079 RepID=A7ETW2_SCLS1|nr:predicted protein [Sclerotinia sclerotiorum 1980 UF-70]EDN92904.1 predicted protein [Sclerotinia sclerotiorum 1980 UF-70]
MAWQKKEWLETFPNKTYGLQKEEILAIPAISPNILDRTFPEPDSKF